MHYSEINSILPKTLAYLDPGSGSILIQLLVTALLTAGLFIHTQWAKIKKLLGLSSLEEDDDHVEDEFFDE